MRVEWSEKYMIWYKFEFFAPRRTGCQKITTVEPVCSDVEEKKYNYVDRCEDLVRQVTLNWIWFTFNLTRIRGRMYSTFDLHDG